MKFSCLVLLMKHERFKFFSCFVLMIKHEKFNLYIYSRKKEISELIEFHKNSKAGFLYLRGRRRVGKSWILQKLTEAIPDIFYFSGKLDSNTRETRTDFITNWSYFASSPTLLQINPNLLSWERIFLEMLSDQKKHKKKATLVFDEIQWLAKTGSGFIGALKNAWVSFEQNNAFNIIICGSSNKFFNDHVGGEEKTLRGLATRSPLWIEPITPKEIAKKAFCGWNIHEVTVLYMLTGGIPYYLDKIDPELGFINAINETFFLQTSIFQNEAEEILSIEFNKTGQQSVIEILSEIGIYGKSQSNLRKHLKISSSNLSELVDKLMTYQLLFIETNERITKGKEINFFMKDFFLNFYFSIYKDFLSEIKRNKTKLIFSHIISGKGYYIENFTGRAFENFVRYCIEKAPISSALYKKLKITDYNFLLYSFHSKESQIDLVLNHNKDRLVRIIECKWAKEDKVFIDEILSKSFPLEPIQARLNVLVVGFKASASFISLCKKNKIILIELKDLFF